jgi:hypothetical protein
LLVKFCCSSKKKFGAAKKPKNAQSHECHI